MKMLRVLKKELMNILKILDYSKELLDAIKQNKKLVHENGSFTHKGNKKWKELYILITIINFVIIVKKLVDNFVNSLKMSHILCALILIQKVPIIIQEVTQKVKVIIIVILILK